MAGKQDDTPLPGVKPMPAPPDSRVIGLDRQAPLTHQQVESVRFGLGDTGPLAQAVMNSNVAATTKQIFNSGVSCLSDRRPSDPVVGQMIFETDTQQVFFWTGTAWVTPANATPTGSMQAFAGSAAPTGWLLCNGASYAPATYPSLYAVLGVTYGGVLDTSFNVPNMAGRTPVGAGTGAQQGVSGSGVITGGTTLTARTRGQFFGDERLQTHTHTGTTGKGYTDSGDTNLVLNPNTGGFVVEIANQVGNTTPSQRHQHNFTTNSHNQSLGLQQNLQPSVVTNYIIKT